jgi:DNA invertase Pin-like site-specific DNA recombinase
MTRRAGIYVRISDDKEGLEKGVRRQEQDARALAERRGWEVVEVYQDNDISAYSGKKRPAWERLLADLEAHRIDSVVAYSSSRMYRQPRELERLIDLTKKNGGVEIATVVSGDVNLNTADGILMAGLLAQIDRAEAMRTAERVARKHIEKAQAGHAHHGGQRPYGYEWDFETHTWRTLPEEAEVIRRIVKDLLRGRSLHGIVHSLNLDGITTSNGGRWNNRTVKRMALSPTIAGIRIHRTTGTETKGTWKPIITPTQHELLVALFNDPTRPRSGGGPNEKKRLLSGLTVCGRCGAKMYGDGRSGYACKKTGNGGCGNVRIASAGFEDYVWAEAIDRIKELEESGGLSELPGEDDEATDELVEERLGLLQRRDELAAKFANGVLDERQLKVGTATIDERVQAIDRQLSAIVRNRAIPDSDDMYFFVPVPKRDQNFTARLSPSELLERSEFLVALIDRIEIGPASSRGVRFEPERVRILWRKAGSFRLAGI